MLTPGIQSWFDIWKLIIITCHFNRINLRKPKDHLKRCRKIYKSHHPFTIKKKPFQTKNRRKFPSSDKGHAQKNLHPKSYLLMKYKNISSWNGNEKRAPTITPSIQHCAVPYEITRKSIGLEKKIIKIIIIWGQGLGLILLLGPGTE